MCAPVRSPASRKWRCETERTLDPSTPIRLKSISRSSWPRSSCLLLTNSDESNPPDGGSSHWFDADRYVFAIARPGSRRLATPPLPNDLALLGAFCPSRRYTVRPLYRIFARRARRPHPIRHDIADRPYRLSRNPFYLTFLIRSSVSALADAPGCSAGWCRRWSRVRGTSRGERISRKSRRRIPPRQPECDDGCSAAADALNPTSGPGVL